MNKQIKELIGDSYISEGYEIIKKDELQPSVGKKIINYKLFFAFVQNGLFHRLNGPAVFWKTSGVKTHFFYGRYVSKEKFLSEKCQVIIEMAKEIADEQEQKLFFEKNLLYLAKDEK